MPHYVYLYRDEREKPRYVGYGEDVTRASVHLVGSHNAALAAFVLGKKFTIEIAGPFENEAVGRTVETVLISALKPDLNVDQGSASARFRPLGVPPAFADRLTMQPLQRMGFISVQGSNPKPVLFVTVGDKDFGDNRSGYDPAAPPTDEQLSERVEKWWQLSGLLPDWIANPNDSPALLIGINGRPGAQVVIASMMIDQSDWKNTDSMGEGKIRVPTLPTPRLDAFDLRGRRIDRAAALAFEGIPAGFFIVLKGDGTLIGGRRPRR